MNSKQAKIRLYWLALDSYHSKQAHYHATRRNLDVQKQRYIEQRHFDGYRSPGGVVFKFDPEEEQREIEVFTGAMEKAKFEAAAARETLKVAFALAVGIDYDPE